MVLGIRVHSVLFVTGLKERVHAFLQFFYYVIYGRLEYACAARSVLMWSLIKLPSQQAVGF